MFSPSEDAPMRRWILALLACVAFVNDGLAQNNVMKIEVAPSKTSLATEPICIPLSVPKEWAKFTEVKVLAARNEGGVGKAIVGQLTGPSIITESISPTKEGLV